MPLLEGLLLMTSAVWRNCLTCSLVSGVLSAARPAMGRMTQARTTRRGLVKGLRYSCMGGVLRKLPTLYPQGTRGDNTYRCSEVVFGRFFFTIDRRGTILWQPNLTPRSRSCFNCYSNMEVQ